MDETQCGRGVLGWRFAILAATLFAFAPLFSADFTAWDEQFNVVANPRMNPPSWDSVNIYWRRPAYDLYIPVTYTVWAGIAQRAYLPQPDSSGAHLNPYLFHAANVLVHAVTALIVFEILRELKFRACAAGIGAMIFALHSIQVEAVAWVAGLKDLLAGFFGFLALLLYLRARGWIEFSIATIVLILAMLSKPIAMVIPAVALAIDLGFSRRPLRQTLARMAIWGPLSVACAIVARLAQPTEFFVGAVPWFMRPLIAADALAFYLSKLLWPMRLGIDYGRSPVVMMQSRWLYITWIVPATIGVLLWSVRNRKRPMVVGALIFVLALAPMLGFVLFDYQLYSTIADRYLYLPMLGVAIAVAAFAGNRVARWLCVVIIVLMAMKTSMQCHVWKNSATLFSHAIEVNPRSWFSRNNFATALLASNQPAEAAEQCRIAVSLNPEYGQAYDNLGTAMRMLGDSAQAESAYRNAIRIDSRDIAAWIGLGNVLSDRKELPAAAQAYQQAVDINPNDASALINLASCLAEQGKLDEAIGLYQRAIDLNPNSPEARQGLERAARERATTTAPSTR